MVIESKGETEEVLKPLTEDLLSDNGVKVEDLKAIVVCVGPGSYTGLRVGIAFAKGLAQFSEIPLIGVDSLEAIRLADKKLTPLLDAKNDRVYYKIGDEIKVEDIKTAFKDLDLSDENILVGSGVEANRNYLFEMLGKDNLDGDSEIYKLNAANVGRVAVDLKLKETSSFEIAPLYVQEARITVSKKVKS
jgi:tRNA threonylcarbamoyladenosine biosynthesis protein TsaB